MAATVTKLDLVKNAGLSNDQAELVQELLASRQAYEAYLKVVRKMVESRESSVVSMSSSEGPERLFHAKLAAEGARSLLKEMEKLVEKRP